MTGKCLGKINGYARNVYNIHLKCRVKWFLQSCKKNTIYYEINVTITTPCQTHFTVIPYDSNKS